MTAKSKQSIDEIKQLIIKIGQMLHQKSMLAAYDGNISCRYQDQIIITNSQTHKAWLTVKDFAIIDLGGKVISGKPSSEMPMHLKAYTVCDQVKAIIHAHPVNAISLSIAKPKWSELPANVISELVIAAGKIPIVPYHLPGSEKLANAIAKMLPQYKLMILRRHGSFTWGSDLTEAYIGLERLEHSATVLLQALMVGKLSTVSKAEFKQLLKIRQTLGDKII